VVAVLEALSRAAFDRDVAAIDPRVAGTRGWTIVKASFPIFDVIFNHASAPIRVRLECSDWDELPPSIDLLNIDGTYMTGGQVPANTGSVFNQGAHDRTRRPFICMRGSREYHTHSSHITDRWDNYRGKPGNDIGGLVYQLWRVWKKAVR
jgi:hypothetical protein